MSAVTAGIGILSVVLIIFRIISPPDGGAGDLVDVSRKIGVFLGLLAADRQSPTAAGLSMQEEGSSFERPGRRAGGAEPPPPPPRRRPSHRHRPRRSARGERQLLRRPPSGGRRRSVERVRELRRHAGGHGDDRHHRVDADRAGQKAAVGDVESVDAVDGPVGADDAALGPRRPCGRCPSGGRPRGAAAGAAGGEASRSAIRARRDRRDARRSADRPRWRPPPRRAPRRGRSRRRAWRRRRRSAGR